MLTKTGSALSQPSSGIRSRDWTFLKSEAAQHMPNLLPQIRQAIGRRRHYRQDIAQLIRNSAGVPASETVGIPMGVTVGLTNPSALGAAEVGKVFFGGDLAAEAVSGTGTENDPWIIENRLFQHMQVRLDNTGWTKFRNCLFENGNNMELLIQPGFIGNLIFENCEFYDTLNPGADSYVIRIDVATEYRFEKCQFSGANVNQAIGITSVAIPEGSTIKLVFDTCRIDESKAAWTTNADFIENVDAVDHSINIDLEIRQCEFSAPSGGGKYIVVPERPDVYTRLVIENNLVTGFDSLVRTTEDASAEIQNLSIKNNRVTDTNDECIFIGNIKGGEIAYNEFAHNTTGVNRRLVYLTWDSSTVGAVCENVDVHHNKFTKKTGTAVAGNECLESAAGINIKFRWNWVTECPEDAYEHLYPQDGCTIEYCVADNCGVQVCDIWKSFDPINYMAIDADNDNSTLPAANTHIHHIYGDCLDWPVVLSGANGVVVQDIYADSSLSNPGRGSVNVQDRDGVIAENVFIAGPLPLAAQRAIPSAVIITATGVNVEAQWVDETGFLLTLP